MTAIRKATIQDISRIAEILIFTKRMNYRFIFQNDKVSFGELQVLPLAQEYLSNPEKLKNIWVYDDEFVKAMIHVEDNRILELYVDCFFQSEGIGGKLVDFAVEELDAEYLFVLEKKSQGHPVLREPRLYIDRRERTRTGHRRIYRENGTNIKRIPILGLLFILLYNTSPFVSMQRLYHAKLSFLILAKLPAPLSFRST